MKKSNGRKQDYTIQFQARDRSIGGWLETKSFANDDEAIEWFEKETERSQLDDDADCEVTLWRGYVDDGEEIDNVTIEPIEQDEAE